MTTPKDKESRAAKETLDQPTTEPGAVKVTDADTAKAKNVELSLADLRDQFVAVRDLTDEKNNLVVYGHWQEFSQDEAKKIRDAARANGVTILEREVS